MNDDQRSLKERIAFLEGQIEAWQREFAHIVESRDRVLVALETARAKGFRAGVEASAKFIDDIGERVGKFYTKQLRAAKLVEH